MNNVSRLSEHSGSQGRPGVNRKIEGLVDQASRAIADLRSVLVENAVSPNGQDSTNIVAMQPVSTDVHGTASFDLHQGIKIAKNLRNLRRKMLGDEHFTGPAWSILLELFESYVLQRTDTVGQVCVSSDVPGATVLRWLNRLSEDGLVNLRDDHLDRRRRFVELSDTGVHLMTQYFSGAAPHVIAA